MIKRTVDILGAGSGLLILSPVLAVLAIIVRLTMGSPVFFSQQRPGLRGRPFRMLKFRTMLDARDREGNLLPDEARLTRSGRFLRRTSLDELPELVNVLKGDMSLVGPRSLLKERRVASGEKERRAGLWEDGSLVSPCGRLGPLGLIGHVGNARRLAEFYLGLWAGSCPGLGYLAFQGIAHRSSIAVNCGRQTRIYRADSANSRCGRLKKRGW